MDTDTLTLILWPPATNSLLHPPPAPAPPQLPAPHFNYLTSLAYDPSSSSLYTAARDARVIQWQQLADPPPPELCCWRPAAAATPHSDWINDIQLVGAGTDGTVLSCSSDCNVTMTCVRTGQVVRQFRHHEDHVTCLSPLNSSGKFVSTGGCKVPAESVTFQQGQRWSGRQLLPVGRGGLRRRVGGQPHGVVGVRSAAV
jgi:WD40 repeat protein